MSIDPSAAAAVNGIIKEDAEKGVAAHTFDADATPEQKAANAAKGAAALKPIVAEPEPTSVTVDVSKGPVPIPTISVQDVDIASPTEETTPPTPKSPTQQNGSAQPVPGDLVEAPAGPKPLPDWYVVGWRAALGIDKPAPTEDDIARKTLEAWISETYYGEWYHNAGIVIFAVVGSRIITLLHLGWGWEILLLATCATYYSNSMQRTRRRARDDIQRELIKNRLATEHESADWMNNFLDRFWLIYEPILSATIVSSVDRILQSSTPSFLESMNMTYFSLGTKAPRIDKVRTFPRTPDDIVLMDWHLKFTPSDDSDLTPKQKAKQTNPKIIIAIRLGKGLATATIPILLEDINFEGNMRIKLKLMNKFPHVQLVELSFLDKPVIDYALKPIGGETFGFDINSIPGLAASIRDMIHATLGPMMYDPNVFTLNLEQMMSGTPLDTTVAVLQVTVRNAKNLKANRIGGGSLDPYVTLSINNRGELAKTKFKKNTSSPFWNSTHFILLKEANLNETLTLQVSDRNGHRKDSSHGIASFEIHSLLEDNTQEGIVRPILLDGKERGELEFDVSYFPVVKPPVVDGKAQPLPDSDVGICRLTIHGAKELDNSTSGVSGEVNALVKVFLSGATKPQHVTPTYKRNINPNWESPTEFLVPNKQKSVITVKVINSRDFRTDPMIGYLSVRLSDILEATQKKGTEAYFPLTGCKSGRVRMSAQWNPLEMAGSLQGAGSYTPPIGVVRLWIKKATDVKNVEATLGGKSDPYVRVLLGGIVKSRTDVINNDLNPEWDQIIYVPVHSLRDILTLECMDYQNLTKDRSLGSVTLRVSDLASESTENLEYPYAGNGRKDFESRIQLEKEVFKGILHFTAEFAPTLNVKGLTFDSKNELEQAVEKGEDEEDYPSGDESEMSSSDEEAERVPDGVTIGAKHHHRTHRATKSTDTTATSATYATNATNATDAKGDKQDGGVELTKEALLSHQSGIIIFDITSGTLAKKSRLEILLDDSYWPAFATDKARSLNAKWDEVGEGFLKEMDFGRIRIRLNENDDGEKESIIGEYSADAKVFLEQCWNNPTEFVLDADEGRYRSKVTIMAKFAPVSIKIEPRESINNMGVLRVELLDGKEIHGADRSGKSDPFVVFNLNGSRVYKSEVKKKTLAPSWNENFTVSVPSRVTADFMLEVFDWNQIEQAKLLGSGKIDLSDVEPFESVERSVSLSSSKHGDKGEIRLRMLFHPEIIVKTRKNTSTFSTAGRAMTTLGGVPLGAGKGVVHGVETIGRKTFGVFGKKKAGEADIPEETLPAGQVSSPIDRKVNGVSTIPEENTALPLNSPTHPPAGPGTLRVHVVSAKDLPLMGESSIKPYVVLRSGKEEFKTKHGQKTQVPEWDETFNISANQDTKALGVTVYDHSTFGRDKTLGEADIDIWRHIQLGGPSPITSAEVWVELKNGSGLLHLKLEYQAQSLERPRAASITSSKLGTSVASPSRFSLSRRSANPTTASDD